MPEATPDEIIKVRRVIEIEGPRAWVERTLANSIAGSMVVGPAKTITEVSREEITKAIATTDTPITVSVH